MPAAPTTPITMSPQSLMSSALAGTRPVSPGDMRTVRDANALANAIRRNLPALGAEEKQRYTQMLNNILQTRDRSKHLELVKLLASNVISAVRRQRGQTGASRAMQAMSRTTVGMRFEGAVTRLSKQKEANLLDLRFQILKLPGDLSTKYQALLVEVLATTDLPKRDALLRQMNQQVAAQLIENQVVFGNESIDKRT